MPIFSVLCRVDAYADYVADVDAESAEAAATLARERHDDYKWVHDQTLEFDARYYVALDDEQTPIEATRTGDYI
ncbi:MAG TPA: hypothetical protein VGL58_18650 [Caulobacteraceae bacterium]|jgi:hypothetical protein